MTALDLGSLKAAADALAAQDAQLAALLARNGYPPLWQQSAGYAGLIFIMLGQQVSTASQSATFDRLRAACGRVTPAAVLRLGNEGLRATGLTRQKQRYCLALAEALRDRSLKLRELPQLPDDAVRARLQAVPGIGRWTADIYLFMSLGRPDIWPRGDLALDKVVTRLAGASRKLTTEAIEAFAERWRPHRAVAARMLWHDYLADPARYRLLQSAPARP